MDLLVLRLSCYLKIGDEGVAVFTELAEKHGLSTLLQQEKSVEHLEKVGGRLMDRADHSPVRSRHLADSSHHHLLGMSSSKGSNKY